MAKCIHGVLSCWIAFISATVHAHAEGGTTSFPASSDPLYSRSTAIYAKQTPS
jgi:hypothetical protein